MFNQTVNCGKHYVGLEVFCYRRITVWRQCVYAHIQVPLSDSVWS